MKHKLNNLPILYLSLSLFLMASSDLQAGQIIFDDQSNAKLAKLKSKTRVLKNTRGQDVVPSALGAEAIDDPSEDIIQQTCGSIGIANQVQPNIGRPVRNTEVIIVGDVINTGNNCN